MRLPIRSSLAALMLSAAPALAELPPGVSHFTLPNGLQTVVIEDHRAPVVVQMVWYRIGSADEQPGKSGIAHYLEHLMFKGTDKVPAGELSKIVAKNGGMDNAFTSYDYTAYFQRIASDRLPLVMEMEADRMANLRISPDDWQTERQVVLEERAQRTDSDPGAQFGEERSAAQFLNHPYGRPVIGWKQEMEGLTRDDALAWYHAHYAPDDAVLVLAGDVTPGEARKLAEQYYGPIQPRGDIKPRQRPQEPPQRSPRRLSLSDPRVAQPVMIRTILAPERNPGDQKQAAVLTVLAELLGGSQQTSVLGRQLVLGGTALHASASYDGLSVDPTTFDLSLVPAEGVSNADAEAKLDAALKDFATKGPTEAEMVRVRTAVAAGEIYDQDSAHGRAYDYGQGLAIGLSVDDVADWPGLLSAVTAEEVRQAAADLVASPATVTGWLTPGPATPEAASGADPLPAAEAAAEAGKTPARPEGAEAAAAPPESGTPGTAPDPHVATTPGPGAAPPRPEGTEAPVGAPDAAPGDATGKVDDPAAAAAAAPGTAPASEKGADAAGEAGVADGAPAGSAASAPAEPDDPAPSPNAAGTDAPPAGPTATPAGSSAPPGSPPPSPPALSQPAAPQPSPTGAGDTTPSAPKVNP